MDYRPLGNTGINVSEIGFGCGNVGGLMIRGEHTDQVAAVARAMELGINYFDTASSYGDGQSETNLGRVLNELSADVYVGTKFRVTTHEPGRIRGNVITAVEESLTRMQREQVDLIQMHNHVASVADGGSVSPEETLGEVVDALRDLRDQGKVRFWGMTAVGETPALHRVIESGDPEHHPVGVQPGQPQRRRGRACLRSTCPTTATRSSAPTTTTWACW